MKPFKTTDLSITKVDNKAGKVNAGVKITHKPTGISAESVGFTTFNRNLTQAKKVLQSRIECSK
ncbi:hypothetical protein VP150E351_P0202 [Vibrio phage 150E35-1]|nr:hypothetical protein VP150E351_P0202 [Vibrio phage 150E35-1]